MEQLNLSTIKLKAFSVLKELNRFKLLLFILFALAIYGYIYTRINTLYNQQPSGAAVSAISDPIKSALVDKNVVNQLTTLQNNSVNVQSLFNQARTNPFQE